MTAKEQGFSGGGGGPGRDHSLVALAVGFLFLVASVLATIVLTARQQEAYARVSHTLEVENQIALVLSRLQDAETGERGFLLTGRREFLQPYENAAANVPHDLARLRLLIADNPRQLASVGQLTAVAAVREDLLRVAVAHFRVGQTLPPEHYLRGRALMDEIRTIVDRMRAEETGLLNARTALADANAAYVKGVLLVSAILVVALGLFAFLNGRRRLSEAVAGAAALAEANAAMRREAEGREAAESQLRQMQKVEAVGQLTGGIAHDFNNMLAVVIGSLDLAAKRLEAGETVRAARNVDNALEGAQRAAQLTARLLAFSRQQPLSPQPVDINKLVGGMSEMLLRTIGEQIWVETVLAGGLWRSFADPGQVENAIVNLCVNARDAMPGGGKLTIETQNAHLDDDYAADNAGAAPGQYVMVSLTDTGTGMPPDVVERAFDPFFTTKAPGQGTGLGLSQVYGFVKQSGGHLKIYTEIGTGTTVKLYLPRLTGNHPDRIAAPADESALPHARGETVLVVEDDEKVRNVSVESLRSLGYTVVQAADAAQAMAVLSLNREIDLLFTDVVMPDKNGSQLAAEAVAARPGLKVLYTTGYTRNAIVHNGMLDADVAFLAKPFTVDQLARKIRQVLEEVHEFRNDPKI